MTAFFYLFFITDFFWCLRRSGFVVGARENGLGARPNFLYAGKTLLKGQFDPWIIRTVYVVLQFRVSYDCLYWNGKYFFFNVFPLCIIGRIAPAYYSSCLGGIVVFLEGWQTPSSLLLY